jgi:hypothetical protein
VSSIPGYDLEDFVMWNHDLIVDDQSHANASLQIAEACGVPTRRITITKEQFNPILALYEPWREQAERALHEFNEETQSWRDYAGYSFDSIPESVWDAANMLRFNLVPHSTKDTP